MSWNKLPAELRNQILSNVVEDHWASVKDRDCPTIAPYTRVSREWQSLFENITFRNISFVIHNVGDVDRFAHFTGGYNAYRRDHIRNISVIIVLTGYQCRDCEQPESAEEADRNDHIFTQSMRALLGVLSTWTPNRHPDGLTLELNIKSSSDMGHHFLDDSMHDNFPLKHWNFGNWNRNVVLSLEPPVRRSCDKVNSSAMSRELLGQGCRALERYLGSLLEFTNVRLPRVEVVTSLLQRHQFKRQLSPSALRKLMRESLVQLSSFRLERWCRPSVEGEEKYIRDFRQRFLPSLPESLDVFQYYSERPRCLNRSRSFRVKSLKLLDILTVKGHHFKQVSVVEPFDSCVCMESMRSTISASLSKPLVTMEWHMLENVCFGSALIAAWRQRRINFMEFVDELLELSASMAEMMPKLRSWQVYDPCGMRSPTGCVFSFRVQTSSFASISWRCWWPMGTDNPGTTFSFSANVESAWDKVAILRTGNGVTCLVDENESKVSGLDYNPYDDESMFELYPIHPFTRHLNRWQSNQLMDASLDR